MAAYTAAAVASLDVIAGVEMILAAIAAVADRPLVRGDEAFVLSVAAAAAVVSVLYVVAGKVDGGPDFDAVHNNAVGLGFVVDVAAAVDIVSLAHGGRTYVPLSHNAPAPGRGQIAEHA